MKWYLKILTAWILASLIIALILSFIHLKYEIPLIETELNFKEKRVKEKSFLVKNEIINTRFYLRKNTMLEIISSGDCSIIFKTWKVENKTNMKAGHYFLMVFENPRFEGLTNIYLGPAKKETKITLKAQKSYFKKKSWEYVYIKSGYANKADRFVYSGDIIFWKAQNKFRIYLSEDYNKLEQSKASRSEYNYIVADPNFKKFNGWNMSGIQVTEKGYLMLSNEPVDDENQNVAVFVHQNQE